MAVAIYTRVSTEEQQQRQSIRTQIEFGERYCQLHRLDVHRIYSDESISGTIPLERRPEGSQILQDARLKKFDQLLVYRLDRLGRDTLLTLNAVADLEALGVRIRSMTEEFDTATPTGRLMLTLLSGFATHEREVIRERCVAGTLRVAETGVWLGGIVPFGYRKVGEKRDARLVVSEDPIPGLVMSEAEVIREVFRMAAVDKRSCRSIAERLNSLGVPCAYARDGRLALRGKRKERTSGVWRPGRIRGLLINKTYMGIHEFGKRTRSGRAVITRSVPAIVTEDTWRKAQGNLRSNILFAPRNAKNQYLLRGLIKCALCGHTYVGVAANRPNGKREFYYRCNAAHSPSIYAGVGRCQSKPVRGEDLERQVWSDIESFLRNPEPLLEQLHARLESAARDLTGIREQATQLAELIAAKSDERNRMLALYRRGRLSDADLDAQLAEIDREQANLDAQLSEAQSRLSGADSVSSTVSSAQDFLERLRDRLDQPTTWQQKRRLVEVLVAGVTVDTVEECGVRQTRTTISYRFSQPDHPLMIVLPQVHVHGTVVRIPTDPKTVGDHLRRRRLELKLLQRDVAARIGADESSVFNWEANRGQPQLRYMPVVIGFLGYNPLPEAPDIAGQLVRHRTSLGLTQKEAAQRIGVDPSTLARWERGEREPEGDFAASVAKFLDRQSREPEHLRRVG
ncbi:MAG: recombinase family protein [Bryobacteraceae bacterium]|nr:recombinase family protein [Bryobacteraceae bacterium]